MESASKPSHVLLCGAGPAGLLLAHYLLHHGAGRFRVTLMDAAEDPREACKKPPSIHRGRWSFGICPRGRASLNRLPGLEARALQQKSAALMHRLMLYIGTRQTEMKIPKDVETFSIDRVDFNKALLEELLDQHEASGLVEVKYGHRCVNVDLRNHSATFHRVGWEGKDDDVAEVDEGKEITVTYDLIVGADGLHSTVRKAMTTEPGWGCDVAVKDATSIGKVVHVPLPEGFDKNAGHIAALSNVGGNMNCIVYSSSDVTLNVVLYYFQHDPPKEWLRVLEGGQATEVKKFLDERIPWLKVTEDACQQLITQRSSHIKSVKSSTYHSSNGRAVLIGDAAHCTFPFLGQGCNASLVDSIVLGRLLCGEQVRADDRIGVNAASTADGGKESLLGGADFLGRLPAMLEVYSAMQVPEGHALVDLSEVAAPLDSKVRVWEIVREIIRQTASSWLPWLVTAPMREQATYTLAPFSVVRKTHAAMVSRVLKSNEEVRQKAADDWRRQVLTAAGVI